MKKRSVWSIAIGPNGIAYVDASRTLRLLRLADSPWPPACKTEIRSATGKLIASLRRHMAFTIVAASSSESLM